MHPDDIPKTAVITPFGLWEFLRVPFGLKNAAQAFQRLMDTALRGLDCAFVYIDDILVASRSKAEHMVHLRQVLECLQQQGLVINLAKCQFGQHELAITSLSTAQHHYPPRLLPSENSPGLQLSKASRSLLAW